MQKSFLVYLLTSVEMFLCRRTTVMRMTGSDVWNSVATCWLRLRRYLVQSAVRPCVMRLH